MNKLVISLALAVLVSAPAAMAQSVGEKTGVNSALGISPTTQDFVTEAANSDMLEIAAAKLAQERGNADEKKFAEQMITDRTKTSQELAGMVKSGDVKATIPTALDSSSQSKLDKLREAKPSDFNCMPFGMCSDQLVIGVPKMRKEIPRAARCAAIESP